MVIPSLTPPEPAKTNIETFQDALRFLAHFQDAEGVALKRHSDSDIVSVFAKTKYWPRLEYWPLALPCSRVELQIAIQKCIWIRDLLNKVEPVR